MNLNTVNRFRITRATIREAKKYLKTHKGDPPYLVVKIPGLKLRGGKLQSGTHELVAKEDRAKILKQFVYSKGSIKPFGRDSLFHAIKKKQGFLGGTFRTT